jgi:peptidoglycan-N-acetylmuramic acid deacetylase
MRPADILVVPLLTMAGAVAAGGCTRPVYLTFDTGHMGVAPLVVEVLKRQQVQATFFLANEPTRPSPGKPAGMSLDDHWAPWWKTLAAQGHDFGSHTWSHPIWQADVGTAEGTGGGSTAQWRMVFRRASYAPVKVGTPGQAASSKVVLTGAQYCEELAQSARRFQAMTGRTMRGIFRAPGGKTSPRLLAVAKQCGWQHVPWTPAGFLGDELDSSRYPNQALLRQALQRVQAGDILLAHLGIWSRQDPWAPAVLEPLIVGLKRKGLCFVTLRDHPDYRAVPDRPTGGAP